MLLAVTGVAAMSATRRSQALRGPIDNSQKSQLSSYRFRFRLRSRSLNSAYDAVVGTIGEG